MEVNDGTTSFNANYRPQVGFYYDLVKATVDRIAGLANEEIALTQQARLLEATQTAFRYWHVAHRPFAITALIAVTVHVAVVVAMGATWFW